MLPKSVAASEQDQRWKAFVSERRCDSKSRGSIYDSVAGAHPGKRPQASLREAHKALTSVVPHIHTELLKTSSPRSVRCECIYTRAPCLLQAI